MTLPEIIETLRSMAESLEIDVPSDAGYVEELRPIIEALEALQKPTLVVGQFIARTYVNYPDTGDGFLNIIKGALFQVTAVYEGKIEAQCIASAGYPSVGDTGWSLPTYHLIEPFFLLGMALVEQGQ